MPGSDVHADGLRRGNGMSEAARATRQRLGAEDGRYRWDVGHAVKFLLSDYARYITGQVLGSTAVSRCKARNAIPGIIDRG